MDSRPRTRAVPSSISPADWARLEPLVDRLLDTPPERRAALFAEMSGGDPARRAELERLVAECERSHPLPDQPAAERSAAPAGDHAVHASAVLADRYRVTREIGRGGMATVYLAHDLRQRRAVAVKVLNPELSAVLGPERFLREIELTASLQHPHILPLFDSGKAGGLLYYVMPYVAGESLRSRLERERQLPVSDAIRVGREVAGALEYAHRHGVIHRDVKPENILLADDGSALVADFGIALAVKQAGGDRLTQTGLSLGTPHYMAPEQALGEKSVDARADVYALGAVLYEMLAGQPPFTGPTAHAVVMKALADPPRPLVELRRSVPPAVAAAVHTALEKVPADRFASAAAFAAALGAPTLAPTATDAERLTVPRRRRPRRLTAMAAGALVVTLTTGVAIGLAIARRSPAGTGHEPVRFTIDLDSTSLRPGALAVAPDGRTVVYAADGVDGSRLYARRLDDITARALTGTENGDGPFFSPDGTWVGFFSNGAIRKVRVDGGAPLVVARAPEFRGGTWDEDGILFAASRGRVYRVPAAGGAVTTIAASDTTQTILYPHLLPGGGAALVTLTRDFTAARVGVLELQTGRLRDIGPGGGARYVGGNIVYFGPGGELYRQPFDLRRLATTGSAEQIGSGLDALSVALSVATVSFDVSPNGTLVYRVGPGASSAGTLRLIVTDRAGRERRVIPARVPWAPRFSPRGGRVAYGAFAPGRDSSDVWITDLGTGATLRLTADARDNNDPQWSPDEKAIAYSVDEAGGKDIVVQPLDGGPLRRFPRKGRQWPSDWSRDGRTILFTDLPDDTHQDIWVQAVGDDTARSFVAAPAHEMAARMSPNGQWVAYQSDETGRNEVYVQSFPTPGRKTLVSAEGGVNPVWSRDGKELYYWRIDRLIAARLEDGNDGRPLAVRERAVLFRAPYFENVHAMYDVSPDGQQFVLVTGGARAGKIVVALDALDPPRRRPAAAAGRR